MSNNAKIFVGVRIPKDIITAIQKLIEDTKKTQTDIIIELLQRGLNSVTDKPLSDNDWVSRSEFNELLERVAVLEDKPAQTAIATSPKIAKPKDNAINKEEALLNEIHANGWLTSEELCQRLKRSFGDISRKSSKMNKEEFAKFSKALDPDGTGWEKRKDKMGKFAVYMPINEPTNTDDTSENAL